MSADSLPKLSSAKVYALLRHQMRAWTTDHGFSPGKDVVSWIRPYRSVYIRVWAAVNRWGWLDGIGGEFRIGMESGLDGRIDGGTSLLTTRFGPLLTEDERRAVWQLSRSVVSGMPGNAEGRLFGWPDDEGFQPNREIWMVYRREGDIAVWARHFTPLIERHLDVVAPGWSDEKTAAVAEEAFADRFPRVGEMSATITNGLSRPVTDLSATIRPADPERAAIPMSCRITVTASGLATMRFAGDSSYAISTTEPRAGSSYAIQAGRETLGTVRVERVDWLTTPEQASDRRLEQLRASLPSEWRTPRLITRADQAPPPLAV